MKNALYNRTLWSLIFGMIGVAIVAAGISILLLYRTAYSETLNEIEGASETLAGLMESVAQFDRRHSARAHKLGSWGATMSQIENGLRKRKRAHTTEEVIIGIREGDTIRILRGTPDQESAHEIARVPIGSRLAEPIQRALRGESGSGTLIDYRGQTVLAGYAPVPTLGIGVAYKIDQSEMRAPYVRASLWSGVVILITSGIGALGFCFFIRPFQRNLEESRAELMAQQHRLNEAQRLAKVGSWELDLVKNELAWSDEIFRMFEVDQTQFTASYEAFLNAIHPDDRDAVNQAYSNSLTTREPYEIVHRLKMADGSIKFVRETCESFFDPDGKPIRSVGTVQDITELHRVELELRQHREHLEDLVQERTARLTESERQLRRAQEISHLGHWSANLASGELIWSDEIFRIFKLDPSTFRPSYEGFFDRVHPDDRAAVKASEVESFRSGRHSVDHRILMPDGAIRWVHEEAQLERDEHGKPRSLTGTVQDITERVASESALRKAKEEAERANRAKSEFLSRMSHELRTPMNAILGFSQVLEVEELKPEQTEYVREIYRAGEHLLDLINDLLDLSSIEAGRLATVVQPVNVRNTVGDALQISQRLINERQIVVINKCNRQASVLADPTRIKQILVNLLSNAAKYNHTGGRILIDCQMRDDEHLRISVTDTGPGIAPDKIPLLFRPFERLGAELTATEGTGIGLSLSRQLADLMGGTLGLNSTPGEGSTFWIDLPLVIPGGIETKESPPITETGTGQISVLYVEDNAANLRVVEALFRRQPGLRLLSATNGEFGIDLARRFRPDVILLDIHLPGMDGYAVLDILKSDSATSVIPVIALSADAMPIDIERGLKAGFMRYLTKPINVTELMRSIEHCLQSRDVQSPEARNNISEHS